MRFGKNIVKHGILPLLLLAAVSCTEYYDQIQVQQGGSCNGYISFSINSGMGFRDEGRSSLEGLDWGRSEENYVKKVMVVLYAGDSPLTQKVEYVFDFNIRTREEGDPANAAWKGFVEDAGIPAGEHEKYLYNSEDKSRFVTFARRIVRKSYYIAAFINPTDALIAVTGKGASMSEITSRWFSLDPHSLRHTDRGGVAEDNYFLMSNLQGVFQIKPEDLAVSEEGANENPVQVLVARAVAKVSVEKTAPIVPPGAKADYFSWQLDVTNKRSYWVRKPSYMLTSTGTVGQLEEYRQVKYDPANTTPILNYLKTIYSEDPNFSGLSNYGPNAISVADADREENFNYLTVISEKQTPILVNTLGSYEYCLENTVLPDDQYADVITSVVIRCQYTPELYNENESYFVYKGYLIDVPTMQGYVNDPASIPQQLNEADLAENISLAAAAGRLPSSLAALSRSFESHGIKYYHSGMNYYRIPIRHAELPLPEDMAVEPGKFYGRYGVLRNNHYVIKINSLKGPGSPVVSTTEHSLSSRTGLEKLWEERIMADITRVPW